MDHRRVHYLTFALVLLLVTMSCLSSTEVTPTVKPGASYTAAVQTLYAEYTQAAGITAVAQLTQMSQGPTATLPPPPPPATLVPTAVPTAIPPSPVPTPAYCDWAAFVGDVTIPDNTELPPGADFTKTWRLQNIGHCTWTPAYSLVFVGGDRMGDNTAVALPGIIGPGDSVDVSIDLTAPDESGIYRSNWMLRNPSGTLFGIGSDAQGVIWAQIQVADLSASDNYAYDFAANYCVAGWRNEQVQLRCPGTIGDPAGFVFLLEDPALEDRQEDELTLWTRPRTVPNGWIYGEYPPYGVEVGDYFVAEVGCLDDSPGCDGVFYLDYRTAGGVVRTLDSWREISDGRTTVIAVDLTSLAGSSINFILTVNNRGIPEQANAFWLAPRIERFGQGDLVYTWNREGGANDVCDELRVYLTDGSETGEAQAISCKDGLEPLGSDSLTDKELDTLLDWIRWFAPFEAEVFESSPGKPETVNINFNGGGDAEAYSSDIQAIDSYSRRIFTRITD
jgi:hypothetical protein